MSSVNVFKASTIFRMLTVVFLAIHRRNLMDMAMYIRFFIPVAFYINGSSSINIFLSELHTNDICKFVAYDTFYLLQFQA